MKTLLLPFGRFYDTANIITPEQIRLWWSKRRIAFNLWVGLVGIATWLSVGLLGSQAVKPGVDFEAPFAMILGPPVYALMANICYSAGPLFDERLFYRASPRPFLLHGGLWFSLVLTALPGLWAAYCWYRAVRYGILLD